MDLLNIIREYLPVFFRRACFLAGGGLLVACTATPVIQSEKLENKTHFNQLETRQAEQKPVKSVSLTPEVMYYILAAEIAGQRGDIHLAAELYERADNKVDSPALAARTVQVASYLRDKKRIKRALKRWLEVEPDNPSVYVLQVPYLILDKDFKGVVASVNKALELASEQAPEIFSQLVNNLQKLTDAEQGLKILREVAWYQQKKPEALLAYARLAESHRKIDDALHHVEQVLQQQADNEEALILKASLLQQMGKRNEALLLLKQQTGRQDASNELRFAYAKLLGENGQYAEAKQIFKQLNTTLPDNKDILFALGLLALDEKETKEAKSYFSRLVAMGDNSKQAAYFMGLAEEMDGRMDEALVWFASVPVSSSRFDEAQKHYISLLAKSGQLLKARLHLKLLRQTYPEKAVKYYILEGNLLREQGQKQAALDLFTEALKSFPDNIELLYGRAMVAESLDRLALFEQDLNKILKKQPNNAIVLNALGYSLADRTNRYQEALTLIQRALAIAPQNAYYLDSLGWLYYKMGKMDKALDYLEQAVSIKQDVELMAHLGEVLWVTGNQYKAKQIWMRAKALNPKDALLLKTLHRFGQ